MIKSDILKEQLDLSLSENIILQLEKWQEIFFEYNSHTNLMSKNDINVLFEKHVLDSLAIVKWKKWKQFKNKTVLDVGCGGGFPSVIFAICFPEVKVIANDSRIKKINFIKEIKEKLNLDNLKVIYSRIEEVPSLNVDLIVSRAVGSLLDIYELSKKHLSKRGDFLIYKAKHYNDEIEEFKKKYPKSKFEIIPYNLPLAGNFSRNLVILKKEESEIL